MGHQQLSFKCFTRAFRTWLWNKSSLLFLVNCCKFFLWSLHINEQNMFLKTQTLNSWKTTIREFVNINVFFFIINKPLIIPFVLINNFENFVEKNFVVGNAHHDLIYPNLTELHIWSSLKSHKIKKNNQKM